MVTEEAMRLERDYLSGLTTEEVYFWSVSCGGQNRNLMVLAALLHVMKRHPTLKHLEYHVLEKGHTMMEVSLCNSYVCIYIETICNERLYSARLAYNYVLIEKYFEYLTISFSTSDLYVVNRI